MGKDYDYVGDEDESTLDAGLLVLAGVIAYQLAKKKIQEKLPEWQERARESREMRAEEQARHLKRRFDALLEAGFTEKQAFRMLAK